MQQYSSQVQVQPPWAASMGLGARPQQGGVVRKPMELHRAYVLKTAVVRRWSPSPIGEWDATTGVQSTNPDTVSASASGVSQSGALNYLNKFGETSQSYMTYDNVSELYYRGRCVTTRISTACRGGCRNSACNELAEAGWLPCADHVDDPDLVLVSEKLHPRDRRRPPGMDYNVGGGGQTYTSTRQQPMRPVTADARIRPRPGPPTCKISKASRRQRYGRVVSRAPPTTSPAWPTACTSTTSVRMRPCRTRRRLPPSGWTSRKAAGRKI